MTIVEKISLARLMRLGLVFGLLALLAGGCRRSVVKSPYFGEDDGENWLMAGADYGRSSHAAKAVALPLEEVAHFKLSSAPAQNMLIRNGYLFVPTLDGRLFVIDLTEKRVLSKKKLPGSNAGTVALGGDALVVAMRYGKETLFYHDLAKTRQVWEIDAGDIAGEPLLADATVYVAAVFSHVDAYDAADGARLWRFDTEGQLYASPALAENLVIVASTKGKVYALQASSGKQVWEKDLREAVLASPVIRGEHVYVGASTGLLVALALKTGTELWRHSLPGRVFYAPAANDRLLIVGASDGVIYAFDRSSGRRRWNTPALSVIGTSPLIAGNEVFFGSLDHHVYGVDLANGEVRWRQQLRGRVRTNPLVWNRQLIVASEDRDLYIFGPPDTYGAN